MFNVTTAGPPAVTARQAGCPNDNWSATITDVRFSSYTPAIEDGTVAPTGNFVGEQLAAGTEGLVLRYLAEMLYD